MFYDNPNVMYVSLHRYDNGHFYPPSQDGGPTMVGINGTNINIGWNTSQVSDADYFAAFDHVVMPACREFVPDLVYVSAGFDAARGDPLGGCDVTPYGYAQMLHQLSSLANGRVIVVLEGGYNLESIAASTLSCLHVLLGGRPCLSASKTLVPVADGVVQQQVQQDTTDPSLHETIIMANISATIQAHRELAKARWAMNFPVLSGGSGGGGDEGGRGGSGGSRGGGSGGKIGRVDSAAVVAAAAAADPMYVTLFYMHEDEATTCKDGDKPLMRSDPWVMGGVQPVVRLFVGEEGLLLVSVPEAKDTAKKKMASMTWNHCGIGHCTEPQTGEDDAENEEDADDTDEADDPDHVDSWTHIEGPTTLTKSSMYKQIFMEKKVADVLAHHAVPFQTPKWGTDSVYNCCCGFWTFQTRSMGREWTYCISLYPDQSFVASLIEIEHKSECKTGFQGVWSLNPR